MYYTNNSGDGMSELVDSFVTNVTTWLVSFGPIAGVILILLESVLPMLPLSVFITLNMVSYGKFLGFIISWLATVAGCMSSFFLFRYFFQKKLYRFINKKDSEQLKKIMKAISTINFSNLVVLIALPFTPAFLVNIAGGVSKIKVKKFFLAILIGKIIMVYFWGYIGTSLLESLTDIMVLIKVVALLLGAFIVSKIIEKKLKVR